MKFLIACALLLLVAGKEVPKPKLSSEPVSQEQVEIYRLFLAGNLEQIRKVPERDVTINLVNVTDPLEKHVGKEWMGGGDDCLKGIEFDHADLLKNEVHRLPKSLALPKRLRMISKIQEKEIFRAMGKGRHWMDRNVLTVSEIGFDSEHRLAALRYDFTCGNLCGYGALLLFEKTNEGWKESKSRGCAGWVSYLRDDAPFTSHSNAQGTPN